MTNSLIFITGSTGFIGAHVVRVSLEAGYRVRLSIRKPEQEAAVRKRYAQHASKIEFVLVSDFSKPESFKEALKGVDYVFHLASPMPGAGPDVRKDYVEPAINATLSILRAALEFPQIKKVVVMSSTVALLPVDSLSRANEDMDVKDNTGEVIKVDLDAAFPEDLFGHGMKYSASKILAHQATRDFAKEKNPHYTLITLHPTYVLGDDLKQETAEGLDGINGLFFMSMSSGNPLIGTAWVHVRDVADAHIKAIETNVETGKEFLLSGPSFPWEEALDYIKANYPTIDNKLQGPFEGRWDVDTTTAENILGLKWRSKEQILDDVIGQQIALRGKAAQS